jgi:hypothetical protein
LSDPAAHKFTIQNARRDMRHLMNLANKAGTANVVAGGEGLSRERRGDGQRRRLSADAFGSRRKLEWGEARLSSLRCGNAFEARRRPCLARRRSGNAQNTKDHSDENDSSHKAGGELVGVEDATLDLIDVVPEFAAALCWATALPVFNRTPGLQKLTSEKHQVVHVILHANGVAFSGWSSDRSKFDTACEETQREARRIICLADCRFGGRPDDYLASAVVSAA